MTKRAFHSFVIDRAENGYVISAFYDDAEIPPKIYVASDAVAMMEHLAGFVGAEKTKPAGTVVKMEPRK